MNRPNASLVAATLNSVSKLPGKFVTVQEWAGGPLTVTYTEGRTGDYKEEYKHFVNVTLYHVVMRSGHGDAKRLKEFVVDAAGTLSLDDAKKIVRTVATKRSKFIKNCTADAAYCEAKGETERAAMYRSFVAGM